jgi:hypothetical protein
MYTVEDLEHARAEFQRCIDTFDSALANWREQLAAQVREASSKVHQIENDLIKQGLIGAASKQRSEAELDPLFPAAQHPPGGAVSREALSSPVPSENKSTSSVGP